MAPSPFAGLARLWLRVARFRLVRWRGVIAWLVRIVAHGRFLWLVLLHERNTNAVELGMFSPNHGQQQIAKFDRGSRPLARR